MKKIKLSIIIPFYNLQKYTDELLAVLAPQVTDEIEVIVVDDGSPEPFETEYDFVKIVRKENGGCSTARNKGLDNASGEYVSFLDADDMVASFYVKRILEELPRGYDVIELSWKSLHDTGEQHNVKLNSIKDKLPNPSVCCRIFRRAFIGSRRFNELKDSTEDEDFVRRIGLYDEDPDYKRGVIPEYLYFYRADRPGSKYKKFRKGLMKTKRCIYYYPEVTADRRDIIEAIIEDNKTKSVWLMTNKCDVPELQRYCKIIPPTTTFCHEKKGEPYPGLKLIIPPLKVQVVLYVEYTTAVGGIGTFVYNFCKNMAKDIDMVVVHKNMEPRQQERLKKIVRVMRETRELQIVCDTIILNRLTDKVPSGITYNKSIQLCHGCKVNVPIPRGRDYLVNVSEAAKKSWGDDSKDGIVIRNFVTIEEASFLFLVSATRIGAIDKGGNDSRMRKLAQMLDRSDISWVWLNFSERPLDNMPKRFVNMQPETNIQGYIKKATYLIQLSDNESFSYTLTEALSNGTPVICTPMPVIKEIGVEDGVNAHVVPYDMDFDIHKLLQVPEFEYHYNNDEIKDKWMELLKKPIVIKDRADDVEVVVMVQSYYDKELGREVYRGNRFRVDPKRAEMLRMKGLVRIERR